MHDLKRVHQLLSKLERKVVIALLFRPGNVYLFELRTVTLPVLFTCVGIKSVA